MTPLKVTDVLVACDTVECGYRSVTLDDRSFAFVWGNIRAHVGDVLPKELVDSPTAERGVEIAPTFTEACGDYEADALALRLHGDENAAREMLDALRAARQRKRTPRPS
jgi:hypothetical protein